MYNSLNPDSIIKTVTRLHSRVSERFEGRGIADVCAELVEVTKQAKTQAQRLDRPNWLLRFLVAAAVIAGGAVFVFMGTILNFTRISGDAFGLVQGIESSINTLVLAGFGLLFLINTERRQKRRRAIAALHQLRSLAHIIDMHQLTKDPSALLSGGPATQSSPDRELDEFLLTRYLDYCSEMLSICGKVAALYAQYSKDPIVIASVNEIEVLSTNMSRKIWQKIMMIHNVEKSGPSHGQIKSALLSVAGRKDDPSPAGSL